MSSEATPDALPLIGYSPFASLVLPAARPSDLRQLDGRQIAQMRERIDLHGTRLDDDLLGLLHDFGVAVRPGQRPAEG